MDHNYALDSINKNFAHTIILAHLKFSTISVNQTTVKDGKIPGKEASKTLPANTEVKKSTSSPYSNLTFSRKFI